jgi:DNA-binding NarL/FixJ family response regulator
MALAMSELRDADWKLLNESLRTLYRQCDLETFPGVALTVVQQLIDADAIGYDECNVKARRMVGLMHPFGSRPKNNDVLEHYMPEHPIVVNWRSRGGERAVAVSDLVPRDQWERMPVYEEFYKLLSARDQMGLLIGSEDDLLICLAFNRSRRGFSARDHAILDALAPHIRLAYRNAEGLSRLLGGRKPGDRLDFHSPDLPALEVTRDGGIVSLSATAEARLREAFPQWPRRPRQLPDVLRAVIENNEDVVGGWRKGLATVNCPIGVSVIPSAAPDRYLVLLRRPGETTTKTPEGFVEALSPQLRRTFEALLAGDSEKEAAIKLGLSRHTVHRYVTMLYRRLSVSSRAELMARFVRR